MALEIENITESTSGSVTSGTADEAMMRAVMAAEASAATPPAEEETAETAAVPSGTEPAKPAGEVIPAPTEAAKGPQATTGVVPPTAKPGEAPPNRIEAAVRNARADERSIVEKEYAWAKDVNPESVRVAFDYAGDLLRDPFAHTTKLAQELGYRLVPIGQQTPAEKPKEEEIDLTPRLRSEDGQEVYNTRQMEAIVQREVAKVRGELQPVLDRHKTQETRDAEEAIKRESKEQIASTLEEARQWKHFQMEDPKAPGKRIDNPAIFAKLLDMPEKERRRLGPVAALYKAYNQFLETDIYPTLSAQSADQVRAENARKAAASLTTRPGSSSGDGKPTQLRDGDVEGLAAHMERLSGVPASA